MYVSYPQGVLYDKQNFLDVFLHLWLLYFPFIIDTYEFIDHIKSRVTDCVDANTMVSKEIAWG